GHDHQVGLARRGAEGAGPKPVQVVAAGAGGHHFDRTARQAKRHRPHARLSRPVDRLLDGREHDVLFEPTFNPRLSHKRFIHETSDLVRAGDAPETTAGKPVWIPEPWLFLLAA